ncbi:MAG: rhodanese-like domain-containing protein [Chloroflexota bacterium]
MTRRIVISGLVFFGSLLLALLAVQADIPGAEELLAITGVVVVISVLLHGSSATPLGSWYGRQVAASQMTFAEERESTFSGLFTDSPDEIVRITPSELLAQMKSETPPIILDVRARAHYEDSSTQIPGSIRVLPDQIQDWGAENSSERTVVAYCRCPNEEASGRVSRQLVTMGFDARALEGGWEAWEKDFPVEQKGSQTIAIGNIMRS